LIRPANTSDSRLTRRNDIRAGRIFALTVTAGFLAVALLAMHRGHHAVEAAAFSASALGVLAGLLIPGRLGPVIRAWTRLGEAIGYVTTPVIMAIVYYLLVTPIAAARRVVTRRKASVMTSRWHRRPPLPPRERMEHQF
jgi:hypothetical protein